jgi:hypothetical protein
MLVRGPRATVRRLRSASASAANATPASCSPASCVRPWDLLVACAFALYAAAFQWGRWWGESPFPFLGPDAANLASWAAAADHPDAFAGDSTLADPENLRFYLTIHVPLLRLFAPAVGDYGSVFAWSLGLHVWLQAMGFYLLGRVLFASRYWAALLALVNLVPVPVTLYEQWGAIDDALPRFTFQALLPFLLAAAVAWVRRPVRWPWLMVGAGLLMYVHPVSAPAWALALWLGLVPWLPAEWPARRRALVMLGLGALFLATSAPFVANYLVAHDHGVHDHVPFAEVDRVMRTFLPRGYLDAPFAVREFAALWANAWALAWLAAAAGVAVLVRAGRGRQVATVGLWLAAVLAVSIAPPWIEQALSRARGTLPVQIDLIRGLRYAVPFLLLLCLWPLAALQASLARRVGVRAAAPVAVAGALFAALWVAGHPPRPVLDALACWGGGALACPPPGWREVREAIDAVARETPAGARILPTRNAVPVQIRFAALRPVVFSRRDLPVLMYANHAELVRWFAHHERWQAAERRPTFGGRFRSHVELARDLGADYVLVDARYFPQPLHAGDRYEDERVVWANRRFALIRLEDRAERGGDA